MSKLFLKVVIITRTAIFGLFTTSYGQVKKTERLNIDTVFANQVLLNSKFLKNAHLRYSVLIYGDHTYKSIKLLDQQVTISDKNVNIVQKLYDGNSCNTDSVIVNSQTLAPIESYSNIPTSKDSFIYKGNQILGAMTVIEKDKKDIIKNVDTSFSKPMFNGLAYIETYQSLSYKMGVPFYLTQYVPGHKVNYERVEYIKNEDIIQNGVSVHTMIVEIKKSSTITIRCWLSSETQELLKIEGQFPAFTYALIRI